MTERLLGKYLEDHLAGATGALQILDHLVDRHRNERLAAVLEPIRSEIAADRETLERLAAKVEAGPSPLKETTARLGEKLSRLKLDASVAGPLACVEALESLTMGILGKRALWEALEAAAPYETRLEGPDYSALIARAEDQHRRIDEERVRMAILAFSPSAPAATRA